MTVLKISSSIEVDEVFYGVDDLPLLNNGTDAQYFVIPQRNVRFESNNN